MLRRKARMVALLSLALLLAPAARAAVPTDNPVATYYSGPEGYPAWTDGVNWKHVINMATYAKGKTVYAKFERARAELSETGGVLYYPAGTYDFSTMPPGRGLMLSRGVVIRGEAPAGHPTASDGKLELPTKFIFGFRERGGGKVPRDWNFIGLIPDDNRSIKTDDNVGIAWVHLVGATIAFGPQVNWGKTWESAHSLLSDKIKGAWAERDPSGTHPIDALAGGGKKYQGAGKGRLVFGCVLEDAAVLDDFTDPGYGPNGFHTSRYCARAIVYGSRVLVANNLLPISRKNFRYHQRTTATPANRAAGLVQFDYGKTIGIDVNKELLAGARADGACPGYFEEGVVVRDNYVFNHGQTGYSIGGQWVTVADNRNERDFLRQNDNVYGIGPSGVLTLDGWQAARANSDNRSRAFDLAGRNLWIDGNTFNNVGSMPGNDGEGIVCRALEGTPIFSWAITHNVHTRGVGAPGGMGGLDADCHGLLIAWNQTPGWVGDLVDHKEVMMTDCAFIANKCGRIVPDEKTIKRLGLRAPLTAVTGPPTAPAKVTAAAYLDDAVKVAWEPGSDGAAGYRVERSIGGGKWQVIAYRPPHLQGDPDNLQEWVDFTAPPGKELTYRVAAVDADDTDKAVSKPTEAVTLTMPAP